MMNNIATSSNIWYKGECWWNATLLGLFPHVPKLHPLHMFIYWLCFYVPKWSIRWHCPFILWSKLGGTGPKWPHTAGIPSWWDAGRCGQSKTQTIDFITWAWGCIEGWCTLPTQQNQSTDTDVNRVKTAVAFIYQCCCCIHGSCLTFFQRKQLAT